MIQAVEM